MEARQEKVERRKSWRGREGRGRDEKEEERRMKRERKKVGMKDREDTG